MCSIVCMRNNATRAYNRWFNWCVISHILPPSQFVLFSPSSYVSLALLTSFIATYILLTSTINKLTKHTRRQSLVCDSIDHVILLYSDRCKGLILLETFTTEQDTPTLPSFLTVVREVTSDPNYSMFNLSRKGEHLVHEDSLDDDSIASVASMSKPASEN